MIKSPARLVEVWSGEAAEGLGKCGSGWVLGDRGVLTAHHVVRGAGITQVRWAGATRPGAWVDATVCWRHPTLDLALLKVVPAEGQQWREPGEPSPRLGAVGTRASSGEAIGFPDAAERPDGLRGLEHAPGTLLPAGAVRDEERLMAFDVDASVPDDAQLWQGFSGAAVQDEHDRLVAVVIQVHPDRQQRRLLVLGLDGVADAEGFAGAAAVLGFDAVVEDSSAPAWRAAAAPRSLTPAGVPARACDIEDLGVFGVHAVVAADTGSGTYAAYVGRDKDAEVAGALSEAANGGRRVVLLVGHSASGKSRCAAEAVRQTEALRVRPVVVPRLDRGLPRLVEQGMRLDGALVWLDDLDRYLARGLDPDLLQRLLDETRDSVIVATIRRSQLQKRQEALADPAWQLLTNEAVVNSLALDATFTEPELAAASGVFTNPSLLGALASGVGLGEYLVGGPELVKRLERGDALQSHLAHTVIAWYRTGIASALAKPELQQLWTATLPEAQARRFHERRAADQAKLFSKACEWASHPIMSRDVYDVALVSAREDGYEASDYVVDHVSRQPDRPAIAPPIWDMALTAARGNEPGEHERLWRVGVAAYDEGSLSVALSAMQSLAEQGDPAATVNVGAILGALDRSEEAIDVYDELIARIGDNPALALREQVAKASFNKGVGLRALGRFKDEIDAYDTIIVRFGDDPTPPLREQVAMALLNKGIRLDALEHSLDAIDVYNKLIDRSTDDEAPAVRGQVAWALLDKGLALGKLERFEDAIKVYDQLLARFGDDRAPEVHEQVAQAHLNKGVDLATLERFEDAIDVYDELLEGFGDDPAPAVRGRVTWALLNKGVSLHEVRRFGDAIAVYDELLERFGNDPAPEVKEQTDRARGYKRIALGELRR